MESFLTAMSSLFTFLFTQITAFFELLTTTVVGQIILASLLISVIVYVAVAFLNFMGKKG